MKRFKELSKRAKPYACLQKINNTNNLKFENKKHKHVLSLNMH